MIEVEVDSLEQLADALPAQPDIVLLDNMGPDRLRTAVEMRNSVAPTVQLQQPPAGATRYTAIDRRRRVSSR
ncbi:MAG: hypothetical protein U0892_19235 [Pirellulales bacterium]